MLTLEHFGLTDPGRIRQNNEDALLVGEGRDETLFAVADGIGGFEAGEVASSLAVDVLKELEPAAPFEEAIQEANRRILAAARDDEKLSGMGTTIVAVRFGGTLRAPRAEVAHVGDSRAYLFRDGSLRPLTEDHSFVAELVRSGDLTRDQAAEHPKKNLITRALGNEEEVEVDTAVLTVGAGDRFVLCSDGLSDMVPEERIESFLTESPQEPETPARRLLSAALEAGGRDNVSVIVVDVREHVSPPARGGTQEMRATPPPRRVGRASREAPSEDDNRDPRRAGQKAARQARRERALEAPRRGKRGAGRNWSALVRRLAVVLVLAAALTPVYLWGGSRYFLGFDEGVVVAYRGLPYAPLGVELHEEWRRTGLEKSEVEEPYRAPIENHKLYTQDQAEKILRDLERS